MSGLLLAGSAALIVVGSLNMVNGTQNTFFLQFDQYNNGLIILVVGLALLMMFGCAVLYLVQGLTKKDNVEQKV